MRTPVILSVIIPARNEQANIISTLTHLCSTLDARKLHYEVVVIDDGSTDATFSLVANAQKHLNANIRVITNEGPNGFGRAVRLGFSLALGRYIVLYMADASDDPHDVIRYYDILSSGIDCAFGSRFIIPGSARNYPPFKLLLNRIVNVSIRLLFVLSYNDITNAFKGYNSDVLSGCMPLESSHFDLTVELPLKAIVRGYSYSVIPITWTNRRHGVSSLKLQEMGSHYLYRLFRVYLERLLAGTNPRA